MRTLTRRSSTSRRAQALNSSDTRDGHNGLSITDGAFDTVAHHLLLTLEELDIERPLIGIIMGSVEGARGQVVMQSGF